jgi:Uma2 family endonuclease
MADGFATPSLTSPNNGDDIGPRRFSVAELDAMFDAHILSRDEKIELVNGEILQMNAQMIPHGVIKFRLAMKLSTILSPQFEVHVELSVQLNDNTLVDPDISITSKLKLERRYLRRDEIQMVAEVSDTTLAYDLGEKAKLYAKAGIAEYWVVDIHGAQTWVHREPSAQGYGSITSVPFDQGLDALVDGTVKVVVAELLA